MTGSPLTDRGRVMYYCHDTFGLGHISRTREISRAVSRQRPGVSQLIVTGSPIADSMLDERDADYIKLPSVTKLGAGHYASRSMDVPFADVRDLRSDILLDTARRFRPDVLLVDHAPAGLKSEIVPALRHLKRRAPGTRLAVGLRDIIDDPRSVRRAWARSGVHQLLEDVYDRIFVYGMQDVFDTVSEYALGTSSSEKTRFVGYLGRSIQGTDSSASNQRARVVVMAGGGGDGYPLLRAAIQALHLTAPHPTFDCDVVLGPLMADDEREVLERLALGLPSTRLHRFVPDMPAALARADAVVCMGGYNTVCEVLSSGRPAIIVPRVTPRREQLIRARALSGLGLIEMIHPDELDPKRLLSSLTSLLTRARRTSGANISLNMDGVSTTARSIDTLIEEGRTTLRNGKAGSIALRSLSMAEPARTVAPLGGTS